MIVGPALAAWLADRPARIAGGARSLAFARDWAAATPIPALARALDAMEAPTAGEVEALLWPLLAEPAWVEQAIALLVAEVARDPFFEPPLAPVKSDVQSGLSLHAGRHAAIAVGVGVLDRLVGKKRRGGKGSIAFSGHASLIRVLKSGGATLSLWEGGWRGDAILPACAFRGRRRLEDGELLAIDGRTTSFLIDHAAADMVLLHATIFAESAPTSCEYDARTLRLTATGAASARASRVQMLTSLLAATGHADGAAFDRASRAAEPFVRWHAMREWLAMDARAAAPRLAEMADRDADPELRGLAARTLPLCPA